MQCCEKDLVLAAQAGDTAAFDDLILQRQEHVFALAFHILGNAEDAADVQQDTFLCAWTKLRAFRGDAAFSTWLHRIAVNICLARKRRSRPVACAELEECQASLAAPDCQERLVNGVVVRQLLADIPANQRALLVLREVEGRSLGEIAELVGSSVEAVRKQLWRVRKSFGKRLRQHLMEDEQ